MLKSYYVNIFLFILVILRVVLTMIENTTPRLFHDRGIIDYTATETLQLAFFMFVMTEIF